MKYETIFEKHTDIISDNQYISSFYFDTEVLKTTSKFGDYTYAPRKALMNVFEQLSASRNRRIKYRSFTVFMGDCGDCFQYFCVGIKASIFRPVQDMFLAAFKQIPGFLYETNDRIPYTPLVPFYRYVNGSIVEYTYEESLAGKKYIDDLYDSGLKIHYRMWLSAETEELKPGYIDEVY